MRFVLLIALLVAPPIANAQSVKDAYAKADKEKKHIVIYCKADGPSFQSPNLVIIRDDAYGKPGIYVQLHRGDKWDDTQFRFEPGTDEGYIRTWADDRLNPNRPEVLAAPAPFYGSPNRGGSARAAADDSPWLSREESGQIKAMWPKGVEFPTGLKFYSLPRRYQRLYTMKGLPYRDIASLEDGSLQFVHSGGLDGIDQSLWRSYKGLAIPDGKKISVWQQDTDVRAFALTPRWRWAFPYGTVAVDMLVSAEGKAFEIRTQTRRETDWSTKVIYKNEAVRPRGYAGLNQSCASCHDSAEAVTDVPRRTYRHVIWGSDGRFSWRPFDESGNLDRRWPIEEQ